MRLRLHILGSARLLASLAVVVALLAGTWPEFAVHDAASLGHPGKAVHEHLEGEDVHIWGDAEGLHVHACHCAAHASAPPNALAALAFPRRLPVEVADGPRLASRANPPLFRPPIA